MWRASIVELHYNDCSLPSFFCFPHSGWTRSWQRELHASSQRRCSLRKGQRGQRDWQPVPPAGQETQSEEEEMSRDPPEPTDSHLPQWLVLSSVQSVIPSTERSSPGPVAAFPQCWDQDYCRLLVYWLTSIEDNFCCVNYLFFFFSTSTHCLKLV